MDLFGPDDRDPVGNAELEVALRVDGAPNAELDGGARQVQPLFERAPERRAVEVAVAEVLLPHVLMAVEMDQRDRSVLARHRAQDGQRDRMVATDARGNRPRVEDPR